jgi:hypothetical protein
MPAASARLFTAARSMTRAAALRRPPAANAHPRTHAGRAGHGKLLADRFPGAQLVIFPDLGHLLLWQDLDGVAPAVISAEHRRERGKPIRRSARREIWRRPRNGGLSVALAAIESRPR